MKNGGLVSTEDAKDLIAETLGLFVGQGKRISWADLAAATCIKEGTLRSYVGEAPHLMPLDAFLRVFAVLPEAAFARVARVIGFAVAPADIDECATLRGLTAGTARFVAEATEALADGRLTPHEKAQLARKAGELMPQLQAIAGGSDAMAYGGGVQ